MHREVRERERVNRLWEPERVLWAGGWFPVAGVDEAGRGPLAGPVLAGAVILPPGLYLPGLNDSKQVTPGRRELLAKAIKAHALAWSVAGATVTEIDSLNILQATFLAMRRAVEGLTVRPGHLIIDALRVKDVKIPQTPLVHGDSLSASVAAASILAKVERDALMCWLDRLYPGYGLAQHKGYPTPAHLEALRRLGPCPEHRLTFHGVAG